MKYVSLIETKEIISSNTNAIIMEQELSVMVNPMLLPLRMQLLKQVKSWKIR